MSPDGSTLYWSSNRGGHFEVWRATADGTSPQQATHDGADAENPSLPNDGRWIYYDSSNPKQPDGLWRVRNDGGAAERVIEAETAHPEVSADGEYVLYQPFDPSRTGAIAIVRVSDRAVFTLASGLNSGMVRARWIGTTHTVAFRAADAQGRIGIFAQDFDPTRDTSAMRRAILVDDNDPETFAISADGTRIVRSVLDEASGIMIADGVRW
jgi:hypothetical protein